jgi:hypothetical protein
MCKEIDLLEKRKETFRKIQESKAKYFVIIDKIDGFDNDIRREFLSELSDDEHYVLFPTQYRFQHFNHKRIDNVKVYQMESFEDVCVMVLSSRNLFNVYKYPKIKRLIRRKYNKKGLGDKLVYYFPKDKIPKNYVRMIDFLLHKLSGGLTDEEKRQNERDYAEKHMKENRFVEMCGVSVPDDLLLIIFSYMKHRANFCKVSLVCEAFYLLFQMTWDRLLASQNTIHRIPILVLWNTKTVMLNTVSILKETLIYFIKNIKSVREITFIERRAREFFVYSGQQNGLVMEKLEKITVRDVGELLPFNKNVFPNVKKLRFCRHKRGSLESHLTDFFGQITSLKIYMNANFYMLSFFKKLETLGFNPSIVFKSNIDILQIKGVKTLKKIEFNDEFMGSHQTTDNFHALEKIILHEMEVETISILLAAGQFKLTVNEDCVMLSEYLTLIDKLNPRCKHVHLNLVRRNSHDRNWWFDAICLLRKISFDALPKNFKLVKKRVKEKTYARKFSKSPPRYTWGFYYVLQYKLDRK